MAGLIGQGFKVVFVDEMMTTVNTIPKLEWSAKGETIGLNRREYHKMSIATIEGVSSERGVELTHNHQGSININKFYDFLVALREINKRRKLAVFLDRLSVHKLKKIGKLAARLGIELIFNAAYSPNYNPIEGVFSLTKREIKGARLRAILNGQEIDDEAIIK